MENCSEMTTESIQANSQENISMQFVCPQDNPLPPDHPLLQKFQQSLKEHLLRAKAQLVDEVAEIKHRIKSKQVEREENGVKLYDMQQEMQRQNELLEDYTNDIQETKELRNMEEQTLQTLKKEYEEKQTCCKQHKMNYNRRLVELDNVQNLENNIRKWVEEVENEVKASQRVVSKDFQMQRSIAEEKKKSDFFFYNFDVEVRKREHELQTILQELTDQRDVNNVLNTSLSDANSDLQALQAEHKRLTQAWGEVIVAIQHRDKILHQVLVSLDKEKEYLKLTTANIEGTKKQIVKELSQRDKLEAFKSRLTKDLINSQQECNQQSQMLSKLEIKLEELPKILEQSELDWKEAKREGIQLKIQLRSLQSKIDKKYNKKNQLEENILRLARDHLVADKVSDHKMKLLKNAQDQRRSMELNLAQTENQLASLLLELEKAKSVIFRLRQEGEKLTAKLESVTTSSDQSNVEYKSVENQIAAQMKRIEKSSRQLDELIHLTEGSEMSLTESKIRNAEKAIQEKEQQIRKAQEFWLLLQGHSVHLSEKRNYQLSELQVVTKQLSITNQKSMGIDGKLEKSDRTANELNREIQNLTSKLEILSLKMFQKKKQNETEETVCETYHFDVLETLRNNEMRVLHLEDEISELKNEIEICKEQVLELHRETLSWETKYKLIEETLRWRKNETALHSEIGIMKAEIHRMEIRYTQLKRAQEKLAHDLEHCVMHREQIFVAASLKQKLQAKPQQSMRGATTFQRKMTDLTNKLKQAQNEITTLTENQLAKANSEHQRIQDEIAKIRNSIEEENIQEELLRNEIEQGLLLKHQNLQNIVRKQNRAKQYQRLNCSNLPPKVIKSEVALELNIQKQQEINDSLWDVVHTLMNDFPQKKNILTKIAQTLKD